MARKTGQIVRRGTSAWLVRIYVGCDPKTRRRRYVGCADARTLCTHFGHSQRRARFTMGKAVHSETC